VRNIAARRSRLLAAFPDPVAAAQVGARAAREPTDLGDGRRR
jgi:hypothetical protein